MYIYVLVVLGSSGFDNGHSSHASNIPASRHFLWDPIWSKQQACQMAHTLNKMRCVLKPVGAFGRLRAASRSSFRRFLSDACLGLVLLLCFVAPSFRSCSLSLSLDDYFLSLHLSSRLYLCTLKAFTGLLFPQSCIKSQHKSYLFK